MFRNTTCLLLLAGLPLLLAACATPRDRCISKETREYRVVSRLLAEAEENLARGYTWQDRLVERDRMVQCRDYERDEAGNLRAITYPCWDDYVTTERYRVAIDPEVETRKRDNLIARRDALLGPAQTAVEACKQAFPEAPDQAPGA